MRKPRTQMVTITNDFHNSTAWARARVLPDGRLYLSEHQVRRIRRELCGVTLCSCGGYLRERGRQDWLVEPEVDPHTGRVVGVYLEARGEAPAPRSTPNPVEMLRAAVADWDCKNVFYLLSLLNNLRAELEDEGQGRKLEEVVDLCDLPSADFPDWVRTDWPVWARDEQGRYLVGATADEVVTEEELRDW